MISAHRRGKYGDRGARAPLKIFWPLLLGDLCPPWELFSESTNAVKIWQILFFFFLENTVFWDKKRGPNSAKTFFSFSYSSRRRPFLFYGENCFLGKNAVQIRRRSVLFLYYLFFGEHCFLGQKTRSKFDKTLSFWRSRLCPAVHK